MCRLHLVQLRHSHSSPNSHQRRIFMLNFRMILTSVGTFSEPLFYHCMSTNISTLSPQVRSSQNSFCNTHSLEILNSVKISHFVFNLTSCKYEVILDAVQTCVVFVKIRVIRFNRGVFRLLHVGYRKHI
jgi:hypothetical protein